MWLVFGCHTSTCADTCCLTGVLVKRSPSGSYTWEPPSLWHQGKSSQGHWASPGTGICCVEELGGCPGFTGADTSFKQVRHRPVLTLEFSERLDFLQALSHIFSVLFSSLIFFICLRFLSRPSIHRQPLSLLFLILPGTPPKAEKDFSLLCVVGMCSNPILHPAPRPTLKASVPYKKKLCPKRSEKTSYSCLKVSFFETIIYLQTRF